jgi:hypothetical protein
MGVALGRGEAGHLSESHGDRFVQWAKIREQFVLRGPGRGHIRPAVYRRKLSSNWLEAASELEALGRTAEAAQCLRRALCWRFWRVRIWRAVLRHYLKRLSQPPRPEAQWRGPDRPGPVPAPAGK